MDTFLTREIVHFFDNDYNTASEINDTLVVYIEHQDSQMRNDTLS